MKYYTQFLISNNMKRILFVIAMLAATMTAMGQNCYWVMLTDKQGTTFNPYT